jgi:hypothetical protein
VEFGGTASRTSGDTELHKILAITSRSDLDVATFLHNPGVNQFIMRIAKSSFWIGASVACALTLGLTTTRAIDKDKKIDMSKVPPASKKTGLTFDKDIKPMLDKSCVKCHSGDKPKSKYRMDTLATVIKGGESGDAAVVPGHSDKSPIVLFTSDAVEEMEMPPTEKRDRFPALTKEQIGILRAWIDQGAK